MKQIFSLLGIFGLTGGAVVGAELMKQNYQQNSLLFERADAANVYSFKKVGIYEAPNGKIFTLIQKTKKTFTFQRSDGTLGNKVFRSKQSVIDYLKLNNKGSTGGILENQSKNIQTKKQRYDSITGAS